MYWGLGVCGWFNVFRAMPIDLYQTQIVRGNQLNWVHISIEEGYLGTLQTRLDGALSHVPRIIIDSRSIELYINIPGEK